MSVLLSRQRLSSSSSDCSFLRETQAFGDAIDGRAARGLFCQDTILEKMFILISSTERGWAADAGCAADEGSLGCALPLPVTPKCSGGRRARQTERRGGSCGVNRGAGPSWGAILRFPRLH